MPVDDDPCVDPGSWARTGQPFLLTWCAGCHSEGRKEADRYGAPEGVDFDSLEDAVAWQDRILARVHAGTMPAGGGPSEAQRDRLHTWFACGAPGTEARLAGVSDAVVRAGGSAVIVATSESAALPGGMDWAIRTGDIISGSSSRTRVIETYDVDGADAWLWSRELWGPSGEALLHWSWDPPLPVGAAAEDAWTAASTVTLVDGAGGVEMWEQEWEFERGLAVGVDGWSIDEAPVQVLGISDDGAEEGWLQSSAYGVTGRWWLDGDGAGVIYQQALDQRVGPFFDDFPLVAGDRRGGRIVEWEVAP